MAFQAKKGEICWKMHFSSHIEKVFDALATDEGRATFWAESAKGKNGVIEFNILNYPPYRGRITERKRPTRFALDYFGTDVAITLSATGDGGADLLLIARVEDEELRREMIPGWVSVLMAMKAAVDFGVDLRNHDPKRSWQQGFADN